jgi:hypothetical protein
VCENEPCSTWRGDLVPPPCALAPGGALEDLGPRHAHGVLLQRHAGHNGRWPSIIAVAAAAAAAAASLERLLEDGFVGHSLSVEAHAGAASFVLETVVARAPGAPTSA